MGKNYRYSICALLFFAATINYLDRQVFGILKPFLEARFGWSESEYSYFVIAFQGFYAFGLLSFGGVIDRIGTKAGYAVCMLIWSIASAAHAFVSGFFGFAFVRALLGFGESGNFPAAVKAVSEWFPKGERAIAVGIMTSGTSIGAILAPASVPWLAATFGWQAAFVVTAMTGIAWLVAWQILYRSPGEADGVSAPSADVEEVQPKVSWLGLLKVRRTWIFVIGKFMTDPIWYFMLFWLPSYFADRFKLDLSHIGLPLMIVYISTSVGSIGGGWVSSALIGRGWTVQRARQSAMLLMALMVLPLILTSRSENVWVSVVLLSLAAAAHQGWSANLFTTVADNFPKAQSASVTGIGGMAGSVGGMLFPLGIGIVLDHYKALGHVDIGYNLLFAGCSCAYLACWVIMQLLGAAKPRQLRAQAA